MKKILFVIGTRPEAIKLSPLLKVFRAEPRIFDVLVCHTGQHQEMVKEVLDFFDLNADFSLKPNLEENTSLSQVFACLMNQLGPVVDDVRPDLIVVQGDTSSALAGALCGYYSQVKIAHVEAGLRTYAPYCPFPEEMNRILISRLADYHFAPTENALQNLLKESIRPDHILVSGNTSVDAVRLGLEYLRSGIGLGDVQLQLSSQLTEGRKLILVTVHRSENRGEKLEGICQAIQEIVDKCGVQVIFPVHPNPKVRLIVEASLSNYPGVILVPALPYPVFLWTLHQSDLVLTDSGGIQEEAPSLGKRVILVREETERPEAVNSRHVQVVGTQPDAIINAVSDSLAQEVEALQGFNPFGDGYASERIFAFIKGL